MGEITILISTGIVKRCVTTDMNKPGSRIAVISVIKC